MSSIADAAESRLAAAGHDRAPWLAVALAAGIAFWFVTPGPGWWVGALLGGPLLAAAAALRWQAKDERTLLLTAIVSAALVFSLGSALAWGRSTLAGAPALERPMSARLVGTILERIEQPAEDRVRLVLATRNPETGAAIRVRVNVPLEQDSSALGEGAVIAVQARLMPPAPPMLPGAYDFARAAWFQGLAATGSAQGPVTLIEPAQEGEGALLRQWQRALSGHVRAQLEGTPGAIAAALASGDRGAISAEDDAAMRDSGLTHLLSISGLHVSAVIAAAYVMVLRVLALSPFLALRWPLPAVAAGVAAGVGIGYTLLTGAEVPTVRSCVAALLVLGAVALGREPLSMRMVTLAAGVVLLLWPESLVGPSFQMSFAAVIAIVALSTAAPMRAWLARRDESWLHRTGRRAAVLLLTGLVIELTLMPVALFHFQRAGFYGAAANMIAIPLVTFVTMPGLALALLLDLAGIGAPVWWVVGKSLELVVWLAHFTAGQPGAVKLMPQMTAPIFALFVAGGLWLALWRGRLRLAGLAPVAAGAILFALAPLPDVLISGDGRHVGIVGEDDRLLVLRDTRAGFARDNLLELAGMQGEPLPLAQWPRARCSRDFCTVTLERGGRAWHLMMSRSREVVEERNLAAACARADIVVSDRFLPRSCRPRWLLADRRTLAQTGGMAIILGQGKVRHVADSQGSHGWWRAAGGAQPPLPARAQ